MRNFILLLIVVVFFITNPSCASSTKSNIQKNTLSDNPFLTSVASTYYNHLEDIRLNKKEKTRIKIDDSYLNTLTTEKNAENRLLLLLEVITSRQMSRKIKIIYPYLGYLRKDLLEIITSGNFDIKFNKKYSPSDRARYLLEFWYDQSDKHLYSSNKGYETKSLNISGKTIKEGCEKWSKHHLKDHPNYSGWCNTITFGHDKKRALVDFSVSYGSGGYSHRLVFIKDDQSWNLVMAQENVVCWNE